MSKGLDSLRRWKKCQRRVASAVMRAAKAGKHPRSAELKRAANAIASVACSKGAAKAKTKMRKMRKMSKSRPDRAWSTRDWDPPDFSRNLLTRTPERAPSAYDDTWGY